MEISVWWQLSFIEWNKNMLPIKFPFSPFISKQMFGSHEYRGINRKLNVFIMLTYWAIIFTVLALRSNSLLSGVLHSCVTCCASCLSDWKPVSVHVFGMKPLWDLHFLLLILLYLLGAVTSQVNPGLCCHERAYCISHLSALWFRCLYSSLKMLWDHFQEFVNTIKLLTSVSFG